MSSIVTAVTCWPGHTAGSTWWLKNSCIWLGDQAISRKGSSGSARNAEGGLEETERSDRGRDWASAPSLFSVSVSRLCLIASPESSFSTVEALLFTRGNSCHLSLVTRHCSA